MSHLKRFFNFNNNSDNDKKSNLTNLVKLNNKSQKEVPTKEESKYTISIPLLVSNDYGSDESDWFYFMVTSNFVNMFFVS